MKIFKVTKTNYYDCGEEVETLHFTSEETKDKYLEEHRNENNASYEVCNVESEVEITIDNVPIVGVRI